MLLSKKKQKGYVLAIVLVLSLLMSLTIISTFTIVFRYMKLTERTIDDLRTDVYMGITTTEAEETTNAGT